MYMNRRHIRGTTENQPNQWGAPDYQLGSPDRLPENFKKMNFYENPYFGKN